jgi:DNA-binding CsgD family transcriptional regulator
VYGLPFNNGAPQPFCADSPGSPPKTFHPRAHSGLNTVGLPTLPRIGTFTNSCLRPRPQAVSSIHGSPSAPSPAAAQPARARGRMTHVLTVDAELLRRTLGVLLSPLDFPTSTAWRQAIATHLQALLGADSVTTVVRLHGGPLVQTVGNVPQGVLEQYAAYYHRKSEIDQLRLRAGLRTWTRYSLVSRTTFLQTEYANEWALPAGIKDSAGASVPVGAAYGHEAVVHLGCATSLERFAPDGPEERWLQTLAPAVMAGMRMALLATTWRHDLLRQLEASGAPLALCEYDGRLVHATPALLAVTMADPEGAALLAAASHLTHALRDALQRRAGRPGRAGASDPSDAARPTRVLTTQRGTYVLHATLTGEALLGPDRPLVVVRVDPPVATVRQTPTLLSARFGLSLREAQVALLLADGASNARIAETLHVTVHTARRHTEHVREKLGAENRAAVARILQGGPAIVGRRTRAAHSRRPT